MAQIVINISNDTYYRCKNERVGLLPFDIPEVCYAIQNGKVLPKEHGDLKDEIDLDLFAPSLGTDEYINSLMAKHNIDYVNGDDEDKVKAFALDLIDSCMNVIKTAPTIIEADKESKHDTDSN